MDAFRKGRAFHGGMHWKKSKGREYLFRTHDRFGNGRSLGPRSSHTEKTYIEFHRQKQHNKERLRSLKDQLVEQARFCRAARINRVPKLVTAIARLLDQGGLLGRNLQIIGTNALWAYEAATGTIFESQLMATRDMDVLWDSRTRLNLSGDENVMEDGLLGILKKADRSFELLASDSFRAVNRHGYMVDLVKPEPRSVLVKDFRRIGTGEDLTAAEIRNLQWLVSSPKMTQVVVGADGFPATMVVPDPRAFALHKLWLSSQPDRGAAQRRRDHSQALMVCRLVLTYLPGLHFDFSELRMFPKAVVENTEAAIQRNEFPAGYEE